MIIKLLTSCSSANLLELNGTWLVARLCGTSELQAIAFHSSVSYRHH